MAVNPAHIQLMVQDPHDSTRVVVIMLHDERFSVNGADAELLGWEFRCKAAEGAYNPIEDFDRKTLMSIDRSTLDNVVEGLEPALPGLKAKLAKWRAEK
tara:strand:- start:75 stop:371 length:297 start_codon:yes stop_codon:yes gene_type:complete